VGGVRLEFNSIPSQFTVPRNAVMGPDQEALCNEEVRMLLEKGAIKETNNSGFISGIFQIPKKSGGFRPIINLKKFNSFIVYRHFKMEGVSTVKQLNRKGDFMAKLDFKDAYLTIPVYPEHRAWLCFKWGGKTFEFVSLPFGLSSAPWAFTKILRPAIAHLRRLGVRLVVYLDDILIVHSSETGARKDARIVRGLLESFGFSINEEKSIEVPAQTMEYIGIGKS
jgi:hypothetical protein